MQSEDSASINLLGFLFKAHPWHGVSIGPDQPRVVNAYIELVPQDTVKFEIDKSTGHLMVDRPQAYSNVCPTLYGLIPQTLCAEQVAEYCMQRTGRSQIRGDGDPLDICVLSEKVFPRGDILLRAYPIGGIRMLDGDEADDKIVAVMRNDAVYCQWRDVADCPQPVIDRLRHYFLTYKSAPDADQAACEITDIYGREEAYEVIRRARADYLEHYADIEKMFSIFRNRPD